MPEIVVIDDDFEEAASYFCARAFGGKKETIVENLKKRYYQKGDLDTLVYILARYRIKYSSDQKE